MNVFFTSKETIMLSPDGYPADYTMIPKQEIANYLLGKYDEGMVLYMGTPINERALLMSYLPFVIAIGMEVAFPDEDVKGKCILLKIKSGLASAPMDVYVEVSDELYAFLAKKYNE